MQYMQVLNTSYTIRLFNTIYDKSNCLYDKKYFDPQTEIYFILSLQSIDYQLLM